MLLLLIALLSCMWILWACRRIGRLVQLISTLKSCRHLDLARGLEVHRRLLALIPLGVLLLAATMVHAANLERYIAIGLILAGAAAIHAIVSIEVRLVRALLDTLRGVLPICSHCKSIRDEAQRENPDWVPVESYISERSEAIFTHTICPTCISKYYLPHKPSEVLTS